MELTKPKIGLILVILILFGGVASAEFYQVSFKGLDLEKSSYSGGEKVQFTTNIANLAQSPYTDMAVEASLIREEDRTRIEKEVVSGNVDLAAREILEMDGSIEVPSDAPSGSYSLVLQAISPGGTPMTFISDTIDVDNPGNEGFVSFGNKGVYIITKRTITGEGGIVQEFTRPSYGTQGENVMPGDFGIKFKLNNGQSSSLSPKARVSITPTYGEGEPIKSFERDLASVDAVSSQEYRLNTSVRTPGTYIVVVEIVDSSGNVVGESEVRLVIAGEGGSITDVNNAKDVYKYGEDLNVDISVVGPADGATSVQDAYLKMEILKNGEVVQSNEKNLEKLPFNPETYSFSTSAGEKLDEYTLRVELGKDDTVYDTFEAEYEELEAERKLTSTGEIKEEGECFDNNVCTREEYKIGNCFDCIGVEEPPGSEEKSSTSKESSNYIMPIAALALILLIIGGFVYRRYQR